MGSIWIGFAIGLAAGFVAGWSFGKDRKPVLWVEYDPHRWTNTATDVRRAVASADARRDIHDE